MPQTARIGTARPPTQQRELSPEDIRAINAALSFLADNGGGFVAVKLQGFSGMSRLKRTLDLHVGEQ